MGEPLILTADFSPADLALLDGLRRAHFPPERNRLPAHLTLFHALPPSALNEAKHQLALQANASPPRATIAGLMDLGGGVAFRIVSDDLDDIRSAIAARGDGRCVTIESRRFASSNADGGKAWNSVRCTGTWFRSSG
jgi:hypothetical protein